MVPEDAPVPADAQSAPQHDALLQSVDCTTAQACVAVGDYNGTSVSNAAVRADRHPERGDLEHTGRAATRRSGRGAIGVCR